MLQGPTASLGIYIDSGSVWETAETTGASNLLEYMAFKSTPHRSSFRIMREVTFLNITAHRWDSTLTPEHVDLIYKNILTSTEIIAFCMQLQHGLKLCCSKFEV